MLSRLARLLLALSSLAPVALTWAIADYGRSGFDVRQVYACVLAGALVIACAAILRVAERSLGSVSFVAAELKPVDNEVVAFIFAYLFPVVAPVDGVSAWGQGFVIIILAIVLAFSNAFTFNPVLTLFGYRFYEIKSTSGISYLLISKSDITDLRRVQRVGQLSRYLLLHIR